jgi:hypothetical protein
MDRVYIEKSIELAEAGLPVDIPIVEGLSSNKIRRLLHWLCKRPNTNYLEIGVHTGSTFIPALWNNPDAYGQCIDIWDQSHWALKGVKRADFEANLERWIPGRNVNIIEYDMFEVDPRGMLAYGVNVYFFDGPHDRKAQYEAFRRFNPIFAERFVALVDDWNNVEVKEETRRVFKDLRYNVLAEWELPGLDQYNRDTERWWNGLYVALVEKP